MDWSTEVTVDVLCIYALRESKGMNFRKDGVSRFFFVTDGAELLLDILDVLLSWLVSVGILIKDE